WDFICATAIGKPSISSSRKMQASSLKFPMHWPNMSIDRLRISTCRFRPTNSMIAITSRYRLCNSHPKQSCILDWFTPMGRKTPGNASLNRRNISGILASQPNAELRERGVRNWLRSSSTFTRKFPRNPHCTQRLRKTTIVGAVYDRPRCQIGKTGAVIDHPYNCRLERVSDGAALHGEMGLLDVLTQILSVVGLLPEQF